MGRKSNCSMTGWPWPSETHDMACRNRGEEEGTVIGGTSMTVAPRGGAEPEEAAAGSAVGDMRRGGTSVSWRVLTLASPMCTTLHGHLGFQT